MKTSIKIKFQTKEDFEMFKEISGFKTLSLFTKEYDAVTQRATKGRRKEFVIKDLIKSPLLKEKYKWYDDCGLPKFVSQKQKYYNEFILHFTPEIKDELFKKLKLDIGNKISTFYPAKPQFTHRQDYMWITKSKLSNKYPIYIVSKNRWKNCFTAEFLLNMNVDFYIIVEQDQYEKYYNKYGEEERCEILILPQNFLDEYDTFDDLGDTKSKGPGAARNFAWWHSINMENAEKHWVLDDNMRGFHYINNNQKILMMNPLAFRMVEDFMDKFENVKIAGHNYTFFIAENTTYHPFSYTTRIYSSLLIDNSLPIRWRGRYNEDSDLSIRVFKMGYTTLQTNFITCDKATTQTCKGGNTEDFYSKEGTSPKSEMLVKMHPDCVRLSNKYKRVHHYIDYNKFDIKPKLKENLDIFVCPKKYYKLQKVKRNVFPFKKQK